jgi:tetratricopeptide (TPR) repeat protein/transcriptional regulator with XRE-family HTH domain
VTAALAALIRTWRERALLTQEQLAARAGLSVRTLRRLESGRLHKPHGYSLQALAEALGLTDEERTRLADAARGEAPAGDRSPVARQLPTDVAGFTGRDRDLAGLDALLPEPDDPEPPAVLAAIAGQAGVGKTALAVHWAHRVSDRFPGGQLHLDLRGYAPGPPLTAIQALSALLQGLGVEAVQVPVQLEAAAALYRSLTAGRRVLVVLDNARDAVQVRPLLPGGPGCVALVTSRDRLDGLVASHGVRRLELDVLPPAEAAGLLSRIVGGERVAAEPEAAGRLAALCGHLPLALRIAAAKLAGGPGESIAAYAGALAGDDRLGGLAVEDDPQAAVRAAFDWSYAALDEPARRLLRLLGLVPGSEFDAGPAGALAGLDAAAADRVLRRLAAAHLLERRGAGRYAFHDLLRLYARERAREEDAGAALERLYDWYLAGAAAAARMLYPGRVQLAVEAAGPAPALPDGASALAWLDAERPNLVAVVQQAAEHGPRRYAWQLADLLRGYFLIRRSVVDWLAVARAGAAATATGGDLRARSAALLGLGTLYFSLGRLDEAVRDNAEGLRMARLAGWAEGQAACLNNLGGACWARGELSRAAEHQAEALAIHRQLGRRHGEADTLVNLASLEDALGRLREAYEHVDQAHGLYRELGSRPGEAQALASRGVMAYHLGRLADAERHLREALDRFREAANQHAETQALSALAETLCDRGRYGEAAELARLAVEGARDTQQVLLEGEALTVLGRVCSRQGDDRRAVEHLERAAGLARRAGARMFESQTLIGLAQARLAAEPDLAVEAAGRALAVAAADGYRVLEGDALTALAAAHLRRGCPEEAVAYARRALPVHRETGHLAGEARTLVMLGRALPDGEGAEREALALFAEIGAPAGDEVRALLGD